MQEIWAGVKTWDFDKGHIVTAKLGQNVSEMAALVWCPWSAELSIWQWSYSGQPINFWQGDVLAQQVRSMLAPPRNVRDVKNLLLSEVLRSMP